MKTSRFASYFFLIMAGVLMMGTQGCLTDEDPTLSSKMTVTLLEITDLTDHAAICQSEITSEELNSGQLDRGVCWSTSVYPTVDDTYFEETNTFGFGTFTSWISDMEPSTVYHVRAFIRQGPEVIYSNMISIKTRGIDPPCTYEKNNLVQGSDNYSFYFTHASADGVDPYEIKASGTGVQIRILFQKTPTSGKYLTKWRSDLTPERECVVHGTFSRFGSAFDDYAAKGDTVYIIQTGEDKYEISLCGLWFAPGATSTYIKTEGNITVE